MIHKLKLRVKSDTYQDEQRLKISAVASAPLDFCAEGRTLLQEIAELIQQYLIRCDDFKSFTSWICCETYPDPDEHERMMDAIEK